MPLGEPKCGKCGSDLMDGMFHHCKPVAVHPNTCGICGCGLACESCLTKPLNAEIDRLNLQIEELKKGNPITKADLREEGKLRSERDEACLGYIRAIRERDDALRLNDELREFGFKRTVAMLVGQSEQTGPARLRLLRNVVDLIDYSKYEIVEYESDRRDEYIIEAREKKATEKRIDATLVHKDCAHGEIMVTHICAECGEKIEFV